MGKQHERENGKSNPLVGRDFEKHVKDYYQTNEGKSYTVGFPLPVGFTKKKKHNFDLGYEDDKINMTVIVECKSHTWTKSGNIPGAKLAVWNEAMFYFSLVAVEKKVDKRFVILKNYRYNREGETLGEYYIRQYGHLIPDDVRFFEFDPQQGIMDELNTEKL